jgi:hypothetical protein
MKRRIALVTLLLFSILFILLPIREVSANPLMIPTQFIPKPQNTDIIIKCEAPIANQPFSNGTVKLCFNVTLIDPQSLCKGLAITTYYGDWFQGFLWCPNPDGGSYNFTANSFKWKHFLQYNFSIEGIPIGNHNITLKAHAGGGYSYSNGSSYVFDVDKSQILNFSMHIQPSINFLSESANVTSDFPLNFTVNEPLSWMGYSLDNSNNVTIKGNTTLTGLRTGNHSLFVYANNTFNDMAKSEAITFIAREPEASLTLIVIAPVVIAIIISLVLLVYFRRRRGKP